MGFRFDHAFVFTPPGAAAADRLVDAGLVEGPPNVHPGQGTANRRFFFEGGMLELLWCHDEAEARAPRTARTGLWERSRWREVPACPFGVAWHRGLDEAREAPFESWPYRPTYLPEGLSIAVAVASDDPRQPFGFVMPGRRGPPSPPALPHTPRPIAAVEVRHPGLLEWWTDERGVLRWARGEALLTVELGGPPTGLEVDLRSAGIPLRVRIGGGAPR